jgi:hypothetical protein
MKVYKSKVDWWIVLIFAGIFGYPIWDGFHTNEYVLSFIFIALLVIFFFLARTVQYKIEGNLLIVWRTKIEIASIRKIYATKIPLSAPALSLDRIAIVYNTYDELLISPKYREDFIQELLLINPNIEVQY